MPQSVNTRLWAARTIPLCKSAGGIESTREWEHYMGRLYVDRVASPRKLLNGLGLAVGLESFSHWVVRQVWCKQAIFTDAWGNSGWRGECSPTDCVETKILWEKAERAPWFTPWEVWEKKAESRYLDLATKWDIPNKSMDFVYSFSSLEHVNQKVSGKVDDAAIIFALSEAVRVLTPGGIFITTNPFDVIGRRWGDLLDWKRRFTKAGFGVGELPYSPQAGKEFHLDPEPRFGGWHGTFVFMAEKDRD